MKVQYANVDLLWGSLHHFKCFIDPSQVIWTIVWTHSVASLVPRHPSISIYVHKSDKCHFRAAIRNRGIGRHDLELVDCRPNVDSRHKPHVRDIKMPEVNAGAYIVAKIVVLWVELSGSKVSIMIKILPQMKLLKQWKGHFYEFPLLCWSFNCHFSNPILIWVGRNLDSGLDSRGHQNGTQVLLQ